MRLDQATISLEPRTTVNCLDLAIRYYGQHLREVGALWLVTAVPCCALILLLGRWYDINFWLAAAVVFFASSPLGVLIGLAAVPTAFGEPFTFPNLRRRVRRQGLGLLARGLVYRIGIALGLLLCIVPGVWLALRTGFFVEQACLLDLDRQLHDRRTSQLIKEEAVDLLLRACGILLFCAILWFCLFITFDAACSILFGVPLLLGRLLGPGASGLSEADVFALLFKSPPVLAAMTAVALGVYPIGRLAWFFCLVDLRVRRDCWDMELKLSREAQRLEAG